MEKKIFTLSQLKHVRKKARSYGSFILICIILLIIVNIVGSYLVIFEDVPPTISDNVPVVKINANNSIGTGFLVSSEYVLTAAHVAGDVGNQCQVATKDDEIMNGVVEASGYEQWQTFLVNDQQVSEGATEHDWALIKLEKEIVDIEPLFIGSGEDVVLGSSVFLIGHPAGQELTVTKGVVSRKDEFEISTDAEVDPGFSGGPMIFSEEENELFEGIVVGIIVSKSVDLTSIKSAVSIDLVLNKCNELGIYF